MRSRSRSLASPVEGSLTLEAMGASTFALESPHRGLNWVGCGKGALRLGFTTKIEASHQARHGLPNHQDQPVKA